MKLHANVCSQWEWTKLRQLLVIVLLGLGIVSTYGQTKTVQGKCLQPPLYPPCSMVQACPVRWTKQACAINTVSLCSLETATFLAKVFRILIQVLSDLAASSTKSCTKFCRYIQHPSLSEEKDKPVEPERLKLKIERYRSLE